MDDQLCEVVGRQLQETKIKQLQMALSRIVCDAK